MLEALKHRRWPGNIRELQNVVERAVIRTTGSVLELALGDFVLEEAACRPERTLADVQRVHIMAALQTANWVIGGPQGAAARLGMPRTTLIAKLKKLGIQRPAPAELEESVQRAGAELSESFYHLPPRLAAAGA